MSWNRPATFDLVRVFRQAVLNDVCGRVGSLGRGLPKGNTYQSPFELPNRPVYQLVYSRAALKRSSFIGIVRPEPAAVLVCPTVTIRVIRLTLSHCRVRI